MVKRRKKSRNSCRHAYLCPNDMFAGILLITVALYSTIPMLADNLPPGKEGTHLILGGTGGSPEESQKCHFNSKLYWRTLLDKKNNLNPKARKFIDDYQSIGIRNFFMHGFAKSNMDLFEYVVLDGNKMRFFKYPYSLSPGSKYMQEKKSAIERDIKALKKTEFPAGLNLVFNPYRDEVYYANAHLYYLFRCEIPPHMAYYSNSPVEKKTFKADTGLKFPRLTPSRLLKKDTIQNREYILFRYRTSAKAFAAWLKQVKSIAPEFKVYITMNLPEVYALERYPSGIALDMAEEYGFKPDYVSATAFQNSYDWRGPNTHYYPEEVLMHLRAAFPDSKIFIFTSQMIWRKDTAHHGNVVKYEEFPPIMEPHEVYGLNAMLVGRGASGTVPFAGGQFTRTKEIHQLALGWCYDFLQRISPWIKGAKPCAKTALLYSRAGEDFWSLANENPKLNEIADGSMSMRNMQCIQDASYVAYHHNAAKDKSRGFRAHKSVMHYLFKNGILFDLVFIDSLKPGQLDKYESAIMPFPYSISKKSGKIVNDFVKKSGKRLTICEMLGETDEKGTPHKVPLLAGLLDKPNVMFVNDSFNINPTNASSAAAVKKFISGNFTTLVLTTKGKSEVEAALLRKSPDDATLFLMNWSDTPAKGTVALPWLKGKARAEKISLFQDGKITRGPKENISGTKLKFKLERHQLQAIHISNI